MFLNVLIIAERHFWTCTDLPLSGHFPGQIVTAQDEHEPHVAKRKEKRDRGADAGSQGREKHQGHHALLKGPYLTGLRPLLWENLPAPSCPLSSELWLHPGEAATSRYCLKAQTQPHRPGLRRIEPKTKTPAEVTVELETTLRRSVPIPAAKQFHLAL